MNCLLRITLVLSLVLAVRTGSGQTPLDSVQLKTSKGAIVPFSVLTKKNPVVLICFWSCNVESSIQELNAINAQYDKWKQAADFRMLAVCLDQGNLLSRMRPTANMNGWTFDVCGDINGDLERLFPAPNLPQSIILKNGQVVYQQAGYGSGSENYLFNKLRTITSPPPPSAPAKGSAAHPKG